MKKFITIAALILGVLFIFSATSVFAQYAYFGVKAGVNFANVWGEDTDPVNGYPYYGWDEKKSRIGFVGGVYSTIVLAKIFAIQPELLFTMQGAVYELGDTKAILKLNYIQLPVLLKFYIPMAGNVKPNLFAGPYGSYNLSAKEKMEVAEVEIYDVEIDEIIQKFDYGIVFGIGFDFIVFNDKQLTVDARYNLGLAKIFKDVPVPGTNEDPVFRNGTISAMVGIGF